MKAKLNKVLSIILSVVLVLSCMATATVGVSAAEVTYYIKNGGTGDGSGESSPMGSVAEVVADINSKGYGVDTTVTVKVIHNDNWNSYDSTTFKHGMAYWKEAGGMVEEHTAKLVITAADPDVKTYLAYSAFFKSGTNYAMAMNGPTTFEDITIVEMRYCETPMYLGSNVTFGSGVKYAYHGSYNAPTSTTFGLTSGTVGTTIASADKLEFQDDVNITFNNAYVSGTADAGEHGKTGFRIGTGSYNDVTFAGNVNITVDNADASPVINFGNGAGGGSVTVDKSININIKNASNVYLENTNYYWDGKANVSGTGRPLSADALQVIVSGGALNNNIKDDTDLSFLKGEYYLKNISGDSNLISFTDTVGVYNVNSNEIVVATNEAEEQIFSENGVLTLPKMGEYTVDTYTLPKEEEYYVQYGGTGDGLSPESPVATVAEAVKLINAADFGVGDTATVYIMQSESRDLNVGVEGDFGTTEGSLTNGYTSWSNAGTVDAHTAKLIIRPYDTASTTYLVFSKWLGISSTNLELNGPVEFYDLVLTSNRGRYNKIITNGNSVTFGEGVLWGRMGYSTSTGVGTISTSTTELEVRIGAYSGSFTKTDNVDVVFKNNIGYRSDYNLDLGTWMGHNKYDGNFTITYDYSKESVVAPMLLGNGHTNSPSNTYSNLNFHVKSANNLKLNVDAEKTVTIKNGLQFIIDSNKSVLNSSDGEFNVGDYSNIVVNGGVWKLKNASGDKDILSFTNTAGKYKVKAGKEVKATDSEGNEYFSSKGYLTLLAGEYTVTEYVPPKSLTYYVKGGGTGDGTTADNPLPNVAAAIEKINLEANADDNVVIKIVHNTDWNSHTAGVHNMAYWGNGGSVPAHTVPITVEAYTPDTLTYLCFGTTIGKNDSMYLGGPTTFKNIRIVAPRYQDRAINSNGYSLTYGEGTTFGFYSGWSVPSSTGTYGLGQWTGFRTDTVSTGGGKDNTNDIYINVENEFVTRTGDLFKSGIRIGDEGYGTSKYGGNINYVINNSVAAPTFNLGNEDGGSVTVAGNVNINIRQATSVTVNPTMAGTNKTTAFTANAFQVLISSGTYSGDVASIENLTLTNGAFYLYNESGNANLVSFTDTAGTYTVPDGWEAVATNKDTSDVVTSAEGILTLTAGSWTVEANKVPVTKTYYVKQGGSGDGRAQTAPAGSVADVINSVNEDLYKGDTANIKIMPSDNRDLNVGGVCGKVNNEFTYLEHGYTPWSEKGAIPAHSAKIIVEAIDPDVTTYLAFGKYVGDNVALVANGPCEFRNITFWLLEEPAVI